MNQNQYLLIFPYALYAGLTTPNQQSTSTDLCSAVISQSVLQEIKQKLAAQRATQQMRTQPMTGVPNVFSAYQNPLLAQYMQSGAGFGFPQMMSPSNYNMMRKLFFNC